MAAHQGKQIHCELGGKAMSAEALTEGLRQSVTLGAQPSPSSAADQVLGMATELAARINGFCDEFERRLNGVMMPTAEECDIEEIKRGMPAYFESLRADLMAGHRGMSRLEEMLRAVDI